MFKIYEIDDGEMHWYSAETKERALELHFNLIGEFPCPIEEIIVKEISPDIKFPVHDYDEGTVTEKTASEWASDGEGLIATTCY